MNLRIEFEGIILGTDTIKLNEITGLDPVGESYKTLAYAGQDGQSTSNFQKLPRIINMAGTIKCYNAMQEYLRLVKCMYKPLEIFIYNGMTEKRINCRMSQSPKYTMLCDSIVDFAIQFTADNPFFNDFETQHRDLFYITTTPLVDDVLTLPWTFSTRHNGADITNTGDAKSYPVFTVYCSQAGGDPPGTKGIFLQNKTNSSVFYLDYKTNADEFITIDMQKGKATSSINGNLAQYIKSVTIDSVVYKPILGKFWFKTGLNEICVQNFNINDVVTVYCEYENNYIEAVC